MNNQGGEGKNLILASAESLDGFNKEEYFL